LRFSGLSGLFGFFSLSGFWGLFSFLGLFGVSLREKSYFLPFSLMNTNHSVKSFSISSSVNFNCLKTLLQYTGSSVFFPIWIGVEYLFPSIVLEYMAWSVDPLPYE